ncbi:MAG: ribosome assembly cofactor RimP [Treponema sp.]|nr:ribosome assembly cofactor RimP [Treponema sp.]
MQYKAREPDEAAAGLIAELEPVVNGLGFSLVELDLFRRKGSAQVRLVITKPMAENKESPDKPAICGGKNGIGTDELSRVHRAVMPRLELVLEGKDLYIEVSSPGTDRLVKEGAEFRHYTGKAVKCWQTGADHWKQGILRGSDEEKITLETAEGIQTMNYETIAKAKLDG